MIKREGSFKRIKKEMVKIRLKKAKKEE
jgi:hypothetical protein